MKNSTAYHGLTAPEHLRVHARCPGCPSTAMQTNQTSMIGPNALPIRSVPWRWNQNSPPRITTAMRHDEVRERGRRDLEALDRAEHARWPG